MEITETQLDSFITLYKQEFDIELTPVEAQQSALSLLRLIAIPVVIPTEGENIVSERN